MNRWSFAVVLLVVGLCARDAFAYPTMIRHGYNSCAICHVDPGGAGALTAYGRAQSDILVAWHADPRIVEQGEPSPMVGFAFGLIPMPEWFDVSGNLRGGAIVLASPDVRTAVRPLWMASDVNATLTLPYFWAHASIGYAPRAVGPAAVISEDEGPNNALVARQYWLGARFFDDQLTARAGRIPLPFGLRNLEHTSLVRDATRTDVDVDQQHGVAVGWSGPELRGELMGIAGNFQIHPDAYRERGYSGLIEWSPTSGVAIGGSSLLTWAQLDIDAKAPMLRHAHGVFARWSPEPHMAILVEADSLFRHLPASTSIGGVGWLQMDFEPWQGIRIAPAVEGLAWTNLPGAAGAWLTLAWHPITHVELRADGIYRQSLPQSGDPTESLSILFQAHMFL